MGGTWNPIEALRAQYPKIGMSDAQILANLQDPDKFRSAFPQYDLSDEDITTNMGKFALAHPEYSSPPPVASPKVIVDYSNETALRDAGMATDPKMGAMMDPKSLNPTAATVAGGIAALGPPAVAGQIAYPTVAEAAAAHPYIASLIGYHIASKLGVPVPKISSILQDLIGGE
jgi:hypothetical protein